MNDRNSRQSFLGDNFLNELETMPIAIIGAGGGGSIIFNELAHVGFKNYFICDPDDFEESNINRLLGSHFSDIADKTPKIEIAIRTIKSIVPDASIQSFKKIWQECVQNHHFQNCKIIFSCLDNFANRVQIESFARKYGIVLIDIGLSIKEHSPKNFQMMGQVVLSHPKGPCFKCYNFITEKDLEREAENYGDAGIRPQVIWANSILASAAIGLGVDLMSNWTKKSPTAFYKCFDGNTLSLVDHPRILVGSFDEFEDCPHFRK